MELTRDVDVRASDIERVGVNQISAGVPGLRLLLEGVIEKDRAADFDRRVVVRRRVSLRGRDLGDRGRGCEKTGREKGEHSRMHSSPPCEEDFTSDGETVVEASVKSA